MIKRTANRSFVSGKNMLNIFACAITILTSSVFLSRLVAALIIKLSVFIRKFH